VSSVLRGWIAQLGLEFVVKEGVCQETRIERLEDEVVFEDQSTVGEIPGADLEIIRTFFPRKNRLHLDLV
jgi:hypothetical protein